jgi:hypothetical protein
MAKTVNMVSSIYLGLNGTTNVDRKNLMKLTQLNNNLAHFAFDALIAAAQSGKNKQIISGTTGLIEFNEKGMREDGDFATLMLMPETPVSIKIDVLQKSPWLIDRISAIHSVAHKLHIISKEELPTSRIESQFLTKQHFKQFFKSNHKKG